MGRKPAGYLLSNKKRHLVRELVMDHFFVGFHDHLTRTSDALSLDYVCYSGKPAEDGTAMRRLFEGTLFSVSLPPDRHHQRYVQEVARFQLAGVEVYHMVASLRRLPLDLRCRRCRRASPADDSISRSGLAAIPYWICWDCLFELRYRYRHYPFLSLDAIQTQPTEIIQQMLHAINGLMFLPHTIEHERRVLAATEELARRRRAERRAVQHVEPSHS